MPLQPCICLSVGQGALPTRWDRLVSAPVFASALNWPRNGFRATGPRVATDRGVSNWHVQIRTASALDKFFMDMLYRIRGLRVGPGGLTTGGEFLAWQFATRNCLRSILGADAILVSSTLPTTVATCLPFGPLSRPPRILKDHPHRRQHGNSTDDSGPRWHRNNLVASLARTYLASSRTMRRVPHLPSMSKTVCR